ncbi:BQ5605_C021g09260 [Microbotryum silenes-dioicae]|uniref:BQ5605_C021g09260 protein n=1 Tax=Microbotryum silenes-dioicae TaxID=796604 RepID=A0A2X0MK35_9BASI|nr:BQ5605_C021g09260 [Microbotryum silenes-dioicae]
MPTVRPGAYLTSGQDCTRGDSMRCFSSRNRLRSPCPWCGVRQIPFYCQKNRPTIPSKPSPKTRLRFNETIGTTTEFAPGPPPSEAHLSGKSVQGRPNS